MSGVKDDLLGKFNINDVSLPIEDYDVNCDDSKLWCKYLNPQKTYGIKIWSIRKGRFYPMVKRDFHFSVIEFDPPWLRKMNELA